MTQTAPSCAELIEAAWEHSFRDAMQARETARRIVAAARCQLDAAWGWWHAALADLLAGDGNAAPEALARARTGFETAGRDARGLALCDELQAVHLRRGGRATEARALHARIDEARPPYEDGDRFIAHDARAMTFRQLGQPDEALRHYYAALDAARRSGRVGMRVLALGNVGGFQQALFNTDDARELGEQALREARQAGLAPAVAAAASNLIVTYHASGMPREALQMAEFMLQNPQQMPPGALEQHRARLALAWLTAGDIDRAQEFLAATGRSAPATAEEPALRAWLQARCHLARGRAAAARDVALAALAVRPGDADTPFDTFELLQAAAHACEQLGDLRSALDFTRRAQGAYEQLAGRSARARYLALKSDHELAQAQRERDLALRSQQAVESDRQRLEELNRALLAQVGETEMLHARLRDQALRDPLTGLHNRRYLFEVVPGLLEMARRQSSGLCLAILDLDHFKALNDTYGHSAGDAVLQRFATLLAQGLRRSDVLCRHGGEEFVVVMPGVDGEQANATLHRILVEFCGERILAGRKRLPSCSFSAGLSVFPVHGDTLEQLLSRADRALYQAKHAGRARVEQLALTSFGTIS